MLLLKMAFRNLLRQRRRSLLTGITMLVGYVLFAINTGFSQGAWGMMIDLVTRDHTGHAQIHAKGYLDRPS
ncbi:MAG TPA: ABC transporter permease, partial [bacterium]|nr:ABC transporter permease [bacterium]